MNNLPNQRPYTWEDLYDPQLLQDTTTNTSNSATRTILAIMPVPWAILELAARSFMRNENIPTTDLRRAQHHFNDPPTMLVYVNLLIEIFALNVWTNLPENLCMRHTISQLHLEQDLSIAEAQSLEEKYCTVSEKARTGAQLVMDNFPSDWWAGSEGKILNLEQAFQALLGYRTAAEVAREHRRHGMAETQKKETQRLLNVIFSNFGKLPKELRIVIWQFSVRKERVITLRTSRYRVRNAKRKLAQSRPWDMCVSNSFLPQLAVCRESRIEAMRIFQLVTLSTSIKGPIYFNPTFDTVFCPEGQVPFQFLVTLLHERPGMQKITSFAMSKDMCREVEKHLCFPFRQARRQNQVFGPRTVESVMVLPLQETTFSKELQLMTCGCPLSKFYEHPVAGSSRNLLVRSNLKISVGVSVENF